MGQDYPLLSILRAVHERLWPPKVLPYEMYL